MYPNAVFVLLSLATLLGVLAPVAMCMGRAFKAFDAGQSLWPWVCIGLLCAAMLVVTAFLSFAGLFFGLFPSFGLGLDWGGLLSALQASLLTLSGPWGVWLVGRRWVEHTPVT